MGHQVLANFEAAVTNEIVNTYHVAAVLDYSLGLIDHLVRFQKIAASIPKLNQKDAEFRSFAIAMGSLVDARNQIQHINRNAVNNYTGPLLGSVSWATEGVNYVAGFSDVGRERSVPGLIFDIHLKKFTMNFVYVFGDTYHDLDLAIKGMRDFYSFVRQKFLISIGGRPYNPEDHLMALAIKFQ